MSLQFQIEAGGSTVPAGAFRVKFIGVEDFTHDEFGDGLRFQFEVIGGDHNGEETSRITGMNPTPKNSLGRMIAGLIGSGIESGQSVDLEERVGKEYLANVAETKSGSTRVESVIPADV